MLSPLAGRTVLFYWNAHVRFPSRQLEVLPTAIQVTSDSTLVGRTLNSVRQRCTAFKGECRKPEFVAYKPTHRFLQLSSRSPRSKLACIKQQSISQRLSRASRVLNAVSPSLTLPFHWPLPLRSLLRPSILWSRSVLQECVRVRAGGPSGCPSAFP